jgi:hypothetical protein
MKSKGIGGSIGLTLTPLNDATVMTITDITQLIVAVLGIGGIGAITPKIIDGLTAWRTGKAQREKANNRTALSRLVAETERADREAAFRRKLEEYASGLRRMLIQLGVPEDKLPPWPQRREKVKP